MILRPVQRPSRAERVASSAILLLLAVLAAALLPRRRQPVGASTSSAARPDAEEPHTLVLAELDLPGWEPGGPLEFFRLDRVYEKIDGKIEFYKPLGFRSLAVRRYLAAGGSDSLEIYVFDLGTAEGAFAAFTSQRRSGARRLPFSDLADLSENSAFFAHDRYYVEIIGASESPSVVAAVAEAAARLAAKLPGESWAPPETAWFPSEGRVKDSVALSLSNGFGFEPFDRLFTALYEEHGARVQAFIHPTDSPESARARLNAWQTFLLENGAKAGPAPPELGDARLFDLFGMVEIAFVEGRCLAGVHEAAHGPADVRVARRLRDALRDQAR
jgi:hypothetical protein